MIRRLLSTKRNGRRTKNHLADAIIEVNTIFAPKKVREAAEYKGEYFLFAVLHPDSEEEMDPFVLYEKGTGEISGFVPTMDLEGFGDAMLNHKRDIGY